MVDLADSFFERVIFINNFLISQSILIKFALKLFVCKRLSFQLHLFFDVRFPLLLITRLGPQSH